MMHEGMDGQHEFEVTVETDSAIKPEYRLHLRANWVKG